MSAIRHERCEEHGELVEVSDASHASHLATLALTVDARNADDADDADEALNAFPASAASEHDHCSLATTPSIFQSAHAQLVTPHSVEHSAFAPTPVAPVYVDLDVLSDAPKQGPPVHDV